MPKQVVLTSAAPGAVGPYSQAIRTDGLIFISGQLPIDPATGKFAGEDIVAQTHRCLENLRAVAEAGGAGLAGVVKTTVFLKDMNDFNAMNAAYAGFFPEAPPARSTIEVARLPRDARVEIEAVVALQVGP
jgi:2-iminobutanoate/2-iminopropanoate deaminase